MVELTKIVAVALILGIREYTGKAICLGFVFDATRGTLGICRFLVDFLFGVK
jgi:hypothetical protein